jgi:DNA polymerase (family 10)
MRFPQINLHIHSNFSDGANSIEEIVLESLKLGLDYIAITDHFTNTWKANIIRTLDNKSKISMYLDEISEFQKFLESKNLPLKLIKGVEIDLRSSIEFIKNNIEIDKFQLILFEYLQNMKDAEKIKKLIKHWQILSNSKHEFPIIGLAHFDPAYMIYNYLDDLIDFLKEYNIYFEFNSSYSEYYSSEYREFFNRLKESNIPVGIGSDSHFIPSLNNIKEPMEKIIQYDLEDNFKSLISKLEEKFSIK